MVFNATLVVKQAKGVDATKFQGDEQFFCTVSFDDYYEATGSVPLPILNWNETFNLEIPGDGNPVPVSMIIYAEGGGDEADDDIEVAALDIGIGSKGFTRGEKWYTCSEGVQLLVHLDSPDIEPESPSFTYVPPSQSQQHGGSSAKDLHLALMSMNAGLTANILQNGADPNAPVHLGEDDEQVLGSFGAPSTSQPPASPSRASKELAGLTALHRVAARQGGGNCAQLLLRAGGSPSARAGANLCTPVHIAAACGAVDVLRLLLEHGGEVDSTHGGGLTALQEAVLAEETGAAEVLLECGAETSICCPRGLTPLHWAARGGNVEMVALLLKHGAEVGVRGHCVASSESGARGATPLHLAARKGHREVQAALLKAGADPAERDSYGRTPAHEASLHGHLTVLKELLDIRGIEAGILDYDDCGSSPLQWAIIGGHVNIVSHLIRSAGSTSSAQLQDELEAAYAVANSSAVQEIVALFTPILRSEKP
ncbi:hypothetical protein CYMTET_42195 [Cymbomonas tetramitiformis]|uniref:C2 domain-containing protein n=1 Tax=Cymbomonas tetramitiformis TaxID=36881 RepID=A0AAE0C6Q7_9CHLO|nr:hypothetical protein CYMTET_42195 [Cymbomonas tetramitiformis]